MRIIIIYLLGPTALALAGTALAQSSGITANPATQPWSNQSGRLMQRLYGGLPAAPSSQQPWYSQSGQLEQQLHRTNGVTNGSGPGASVPLTGPINAPWAQQAQQQRQGLTGMAEVPSSPLSTTGAGADSDRGHGAPNPFGRLAPFTSLGNAQRFNGSFNPEQAAAGSRYTSLGNALRSGSVPAPCTRSPAAGCR